MRKKNWPLFCHFRPSTPGTVSLRTPFQKSAEKRKKWPDHLKLSIFFIYSKQKEKKSKKKSDVNMGLPVRALFVIFHPCLKVIPIFRELLWKNKEKIAKTPTAEVCGIHFWIIPKNLSLLVTKGTVAELRTFHIFLHPPKWCAVFFTSIDQKTWNFQKSRA